MNFVKIYITEKFRNFSRNVFIFAFRGNKKKNIFVQTLVTGTTWCGPDSVVGNVEKGEGGGGGQPQGEFLQLVPAQVQPHQALHLAQVFTSIKLQTYFFCSGFPAAQRH